MPIRKLQIDWHLIFILLIPVILLLSSQQWFFPMGGGTDAQYNLAYFFDYGKDPGLFYNYRAARLAWILKGWMCYHLFSPLIAHYVLNLFELYTSILCCYFIAKILFNKDVAFVGTVIFSTYTLFHFIPGFDWHYSNHDSIANIFLCLLFILLAVKTKYRKSLLLLAGCMAAAVVQSPYATLTFLGIVFWFLYLNWNKRVLQGAVLFLLGTILMTSIFCLISYSVGGPLLYFTPQLWIHHISWLWYPLREPVINLAIFGGTPRYHPGNWLPLRLLAVYQYGTLFPFFTVILSLVSGIVWWKKRKFFQYNSSVVLVFSSFFCSFLTFLIFHLLGYQSLTHDHVVICLVPMLALAICANMSIFYESPKFSAISRNVLNTIVYILFLGILIFEINQYVLIGHKKYFIFCCSLTVFFILGVRFSKYLYPKLENVQTKYKILISSLAFVCCIFILRNLGKLDATIERLLTKLLTFLATLNSPISGFNIYQVILIFAILALPFIAFSYWKTLRKYTAFLIVCALYVTLNIYSSMISLSNYSIHHYYNWQKDQFLAVVDTFKLLDTYDNNSRYIVWYQSQTIPISQLKTKRSLDITGLILDGTYMGIVYGRYVQPEAYSWSEGSLFKKTFKELPDYAHWKSELPYLELYSGPLYFVIDGGGCAANWFSTFANVPLNQLWLKVIPNTIKIAFLFHNAGALKQAENTLKMNGFNLTNLNEHRIEEGVISYYVVTGIAQRINPRHTMAVKFPYSENS